MDYESKTLLELKKMCKERGLKISGTKDEVVIRLMENDESTESIQMENQPVQVQGQVPVQTFAQQHMKVEPSRFPSILTGQMQVIGQQPSQNKIPIFGTIAIISFIIGLLLIFWDGGNVTSGPMAVSDGCCWGSMLVFCSLVMLPLALFETLRNDKPPVIKYIPQEFTQK
tara:strand:+ start:222 stop:731 length:510 start_codon:yes stop_codon:yes gene_type:complete